jgi:hypothetical protein
MLMMYATQKGMSSMDHPFDTMDHDQIEAMRGQETLTIELDQVDAFFVMSALFSAPLEGFVPCGHEVLGVRNFMAQVREQARERMFMREQGLHSDKSKSRK